MHKIKICAAAALLAATGLAFTETGHETACRLTLTSVECAAYKDLHDVNALNANVDALLNKPVQVDSNDFEKFLAAN